MSQPENQPKWVKSSLSYANGNCVEVAWVESSLSEAGNCVEMIADLETETIKVRNSRDPEGGVLEFTRNEWDAFTGGVRLGEFD